MQDEFPKSIERLSPGIHVKDHGALLDYTGKLVMALRIYRTLHLCGFPLCPPSYL